MKKYIAIIASALLLCTSVFIFTGCPSDTAPGTPPTVEETKQVIQGASVGYPPAGWPDAFTAFSAIPLIDLIIMVANIYLEMPGWQGSDGTYSVSISGAGNDFTLTLRIVWDATRGMWHYTLTIDGSIDPYTYDNVDIFEMYALQDGSSGEITFHDPDSPNDYLSVTWDMGDTYITFTMDAMFDGDSFTVTLVETYPVYVIDQWISSSGRIRIEAPPGVTIFNEEWGPSPPPPF
jgi:hypothetical protein